jgi:hypothetical protein
MKKYVDGLIKCFRNLTPTQKARLEWHRQQGTKILCGDKADNWIAGKAG